MFNILIAIAIAVAFGGSPRFAHATMPAVSPIYSASKFVPPGLREHARGESERELARQGHYGSRARGYAILIAAMVVAAAATSRLSAILPERLQFLSYFVSQVSTLGVYVFGAPIWEPLASGFRKAAFGVEVPAAEDKDEALENLWRRTQRAYSLNEQMSRNVITSFLTSTKQNFYQAHRAMTEHDPRYAAEQIAEAAVRLRLYFADISPRDGSVTAAIRSAFTDHVAVDAEFYREVVAAIRRLDPATPDLEVAYGEVLRAWLGRL